MKIPNIPSDIFTNFNHVKYYDEPHKYFINEKQLVSVTTLIHKYENEFEEDYWANKKSEEFNISPNNIKYTWDFINKKGTKKGSIIHDYAENLFLNKVFPYPKDEIFSIFGFDPILKEYEITKKHVDNFYKDCYNKLIPIKTELVVCDEELGIGGMVDMLFYNIRSRKFEIWDWKTNKKFSTTNEYQRLLPPLSHLEECDLEIYSLQLGLYKHIIEKYTSLKLGNSYLVWFSHNNDNYKVIKTKDRENEVKLLLADYKSKILA